MKKYLSPEFDYIKLDIFQDILTSSEDEIPVEDVDGDFTGDDFDW